MCGIGLIVGRSPVRATVGWEMLDTIRHRGPDGAGVVVFHDDQVGLSRAPDDEKASMAGNVVLAHVRLAIIDLHDTGFQPMTDETSRVWVVFNGEIYNYRELRRELQGRGHRFISSSDTEVLVHGWDEWGESLFERIEGIFAFALHDRTTGRTVIARDRLGVKPIYYAQQPDGTLLAASEIKALLVAGCDAQPDPAGIASFLTWRWVADPDTAFTGIKKLEPGHFLDVGQRRPLTPRCYWDFAYEQTRGSVDDESENLRAATEEAVARQLMSDVPLGAFFSGGIDSTAIVEIMRRRLSPNLPTCFTVGFSERDLAYDVVPDDLRFARLYAAGAAIDYREAILEPKLAEALPRVVWHMDEPIADPAALSAFRICEAASQDFTVLLSGMGGDEIFGGYPRYVATKIASQFRRLPSPLRHLARRAAFALPAAGRGRIPRLGRNAQKLLGEANLPFPDNYLSLLTYFDAGARSDLYSADFAEVLRSTPPHASLERHLERVDGLHWLDQAMYLDLKTFLPALNLTYMDKMSMAHSIEVRVPLLDEHVLRVMQRASPEAKIQGYRTKVLFKNATREIVPKEIRERGKAGFGAPIRGWLVHELAPLVDDLLSPDTVRRRGIFNTKQVDRLIADFRSGHRDNALQIWQLLTLEMWHQVFIDADTSLIRAVGRNR
jgi:asparagine synthase (glutamine-hydrolysing)